MHDTCVAGHNNRKSPDPVKKPAPHNGPQVDVLYGFGGAVVEGVGYPSASESYKELTGKDVPNANLR